MVVLLEPEKRSLEIADDEHEHMHEQLLLPSSVKHNSERHEKRRRSRRRWQFLKLAVFCSVLLIYTTFRSHRGEHRHHRGGRRPQTRTKHFEELLLSVPSADVALAISRKYATVPHLAGSPGDYESAKTILELFQTEFGIATPSELPVFPAGTSESRNATLGITSLKRPSAWIDVYYPVLNTPLDRSLEILGDDGKPIWSADLVEHGDELDPEAAKYADAVPTFHGLSKGGEVEGQLIFANYGTKEDFDELVAAGANFTGKIVIARYGANYRGMKIKAAEELGAVGIIIYTDPRDDGHVTVGNGYAPYPHGPARAPTSVQRGSVQYISVYPSDPTTPFEPAYENATRVEGWNIPKIPSLPISWVNAERLLEEISEDKDNKLLSGLVSQKTIKLVNHVDTKVTPVWNTMVAIPGHIADEVVVVGNHRDAWVMGAADPTSGTVALHEVIRAFGVLLRSGWKPLRTIVFASWDAEEYTLVGSTEWGEDFGAWISSHVVSYLNLDVAVSGAQWNTWGSPSLAHLIRKTAQDVPHPTLPGKTLWDARNDEGPFEGIGDKDFMASYEAAELQRQSSDTGVEPLGSGSDFTVFLQHLGVASMDQGFGNTPSDAVFHYHSIYDSQRWQEQYADPGFQRHIAVAKHLGLMTLRVTDAIILPLNTTQYALELHQYLDRVEKIASTTSINADFSDLRKAISNLQSASVELDEEKEEAEENFKHLLRQLPGRRGLCRRGKFARVANWIKRLFGVYHPIHGHGHHEPGYWMDVAFGQIDVEMPKKDYPPHKPNTHRSLEFPIRKFIKAAKRVRKANQKLMAFERGFISEGGIKDRTWYKHLGVAPGLWLGYGATTLPGLTEAFTLHNNTTLVEYEARRLTDLLQKLSVQLRP